jgi:hypothetical protein
MTANAVDLLYLYPCSMVQYRRGIILYLEYQSVRPFVRIGTPQTLTRKRGCPSLPGTGWGGNTWVRGRGEPIRTTGEKAWHSVYSGAQYFMCNYSNPFIPYCLFINHLVSIQYSHVLLLKRSNKTHSIQVIVFHIYFFKINNKKIIII